MDTPTRKIESADTTVIETLTLPYQLGDYELLSVIGYGGMGVVYRARHRSLESEAAVKVLNPTIAYHPAARRRFLQEARVTAALRHEGVVRVVHVGEDGPVLYLVMELLEGESLAERLTHGPALGMADTARIGREVASALAEAHQHSLVHRDIKPGNLFLERRNDGSRTKLLDFGIARRVNAEEALTSLNALVGTPRYMAPEQLADSQVGSPADIFSLGCVLYELASGHNPFDAPSHAAVFRKIAEYDPPPLKELHPDLPEAFSALVHDCLQKDPTQRPSAKAVEAALAAVEADPGSFAWLQTVSRPVARPTPRRRWLVPVLVTIVALAVAGGVAFRLLPQPDPTVNPLVPVLEDKTQAVLTRWKMDDPPPLDVWLQGRRIRTVRQQGEAEFSSLIAALSAVQPGEAIEILDAGPYTEVSQGPDGAPGLAVPKDVGLFSRTGAVLRVPEYLADSNIQMANGRVCYHGATIFARPGVRLHGLTFRADSPPDNTEDATAWRLAMVGPCVVENCLFLRPRAPRPEKHFKSLSLHFSQAAPSQLTLRRCWLEGTLNTHYRDPAVRTEGRVENCVLTDAAQNLWLNLANTRWAFVENVFQAEDLCAALGTTRYRPGMGQPELLIARNTFLTKRRSSLRVERYEKGKLATVQASLFGNVFSGPQDAVAFTSSADAEESRFWSADANWSSGKSGIEWLKVREGGLSFASLNAMDPTFGRLTNAEPSARAPGAIPPETPTWLAALQERRRAAGQ